MKISRIVLRLLKMPFVSFFETSFGRVYKKEVILVQVHDDSGKDGWGECVAAENPFYSYEDVHSAWSVLTRLISPRILEPPISTPEDLPEMVSFVRGHPMAKAAVEMALWDLYSKKLEKPLWRVLGGVYEKIPCGVSIGIQDHPDDLLEKIEAELEAGYQKIKIKIKPGWDVEITRLVRQHFPEAPLMVDANSAYRLSDAEHLKVLDQFDLMMIEQPLYYDDIYEHSLLQQRISTPVCLDESIRHHRDARLALQLGACRVINLKIGRVGGLVEAIKIHDLCKEQEIPVWCGGMLETGIGRAHNIALSTLQNFVVPGDVSASARYFGRDIIQPPVEVNPQGFIEVPEAPGIGYQPDLEWIEEKTVKRQAITCD